MSWRNQTNTRLAHAPHTTAIEPIENNRKSLEIIERVVRKALYWPTHLSDIIGFLNDFCRRGLSNFLHMLDRGNLLDGNFFHFRLSRGLRNNNVLFRLDLCIMR